MRLSSSISSEPVEISSPESKFIEVTVPDTSVVMSTPWKATSVPMALIRRFHCELFASATVTLIGGGSWLPTEIGGVLVYGAVALAGQRRYPLLLSFGWLAHVAWVM